MTLKGRFTISTRDLLRNLLLFLLIRKVHELWVNTLLNYRVQSDVQNN